MDPVIAPRSHSARLDAINLMLRDLHTRHDEIRHRAAFQNDETLLRLDSPLLAAHFAAETDRLWRGAELGITARMERKQLKQRRRCGSGQQRPEGAGGGGAGTAANSSAPRGREAGDDYDENSYRGLSGAPWIRFLPPASIRLGLMRSI